MAKRTDQNSYNRKKNYQNQGYVSGNAVKKSEVFVSYPERERQRERKRQAWVRRQREEQIKKGRKELREFSLLHMGGFIVAIVSVLVICSQYVKLEASVTTNMRNLEKLETEYSQLVIDNDALKAQIDAGVDLDYIFKVATEELGMVYPSKSQVVNYDRVESEYVRQYEDIPND